MSVNAMAPCWSASRIGRRQGWRLGALLLLAGACSHDPAASLGTPLSPTGTASSDATGESRGQTPRRLRRLSNAELDNVLGDLLGAPLFVTKGFLPDPRVEGYDNDVATLDTSESKVDEIATAAERVADFITAPTRLSAFAPCTTDEQPGDCARRFASWLALRAYGRPLTDDERQRLDDVFSVGFTDGDYASGVRLLVSAMLQSPYFVYRLELGAGMPPKDAQEVQLDGYEIASQLSFLLQGRRPDAELQAAAASGGLVNASIREQQSRRLLAGPAARAHLRGFLRAWLGLKDVAVINKDLGVLPVFTPQVRFALERELETFLDDVLVRSDGRLDEFFVADYTFPGPALVPIYQDDLKGPPGDFQRVGLDTRHRRGLLSSPAFLATHAGIAQTNPVQRGLVIRGRLLCQDVPPPPANVMAQAPAASTTQTTRGKYEAHAQDPFCRSCHRLMDPLGFGFENFDTLGRFQSVEGPAQLPIDGRGEIAGSDIDGVFTGPAELSLRLVGSTLFRRCFVKQLWRFGEGRAAEAGDAPLLAHLARVFESGQGRIGAALLGVVGSPAFIVRRVESEP